MTVRGTVRAAECLARRQGESLKGPRYGIACISLLLIIIGTH